jgi:glycosyltransferase involved in cell wall biosynthesis
MIEAMACGTPVIAFRRGSVPEILEHGRTGLVVDDIDQAIAAVARAGELDRAAIRERFETRFSVERMAHDYLAIYERSLQMRREVVRRRTAPPESISVSVGERYGHA